MGRLRHQPRCGELRLADAVRRVAPVLCGDVDPLVHENMRNGLGHGACSRVTRQSQRRWIQYLRHARAIDVDVWLNLSLHTQYPSQRPGLEWAVGLLHHITTSNELYLNDIRKLFAGDQLAVAQQALTGVDSM